MPDIDVTLVNALNAALVTDAAADKTLQTAFTDVRAAKQNVINLTQGVLAGRGAASGTGGPETILLGTNLSMTGTTLNATGGGGGGSDPDTVTATVSATYPASLQTSFRYELTMASSQNIDLDQFPWPVNKSKPVTLLFIQGAGLNSIPTLVTVTRTLRWHGGVPPIWHVGAVNNWDVVVVTPNAAGTVLYAGLAGSSRP